MLRFELIFRLTSSYDENYFHVHTLKVCSVFVLLCLLCDLGSTWLTSTMASAQGIMQASLVRYSLVWRTTIS